MFQYALIVKLLFKPQKNPWTTDLKWCNYIVCPAEGGQLFKNRGRK